MAKKFGVTMAQLDAVSKQLEDLSGQYEAIRNTLVDESTGTLTAAWSGADNKAFVNKISSFCMELKQMSEKLHTVSEAMSLQEDNYTTQQQNNIAAAQRLPG